MSRENKIAEPAHGAAIANDMAELDATLPTPTGQDRYRALIEASPDAITLVDLTGRITLANRQAALLYGIDQPAELIGRMADDFVAAEDRDRVKSMERGLHETGLAHGNTYALVHHGTRVYIEMSASIVYDDGGRPIGVMRTERDVTARRQAEQQLGQLLRDKELLLREIHHRVKNNMQTVSSLLSLQSGRVQDKEAISALQDSQSRIGAMALVHDKLYRSPTAETIDFGQYIYDLVANIRRLYLGDGSNIAVHIQTEKVFLGIDMAIPCGLIVQELMTNAFKHAFPGERRGEVRVQMDATGEGLVRLRLSDNGVGLPESGVPETQGLGLQLIHTLIAQIRGSLEIERKDGAAFTIVFPKDAL